MISSYSSVRPARPRLSQRGCSSALPRVSKIIRRSTGSSRDREGPSSRSGDFLDPDPALVITGDLLAVTGKRLVKGQEGRTRRGWRSTPRFHTFAVEGVLSEGGYEQKRGCEGVEAKPTFES